MGFIICDGELRKYTQEPGVTEVVIPDGVTSIENGAFWECSSLTAVTIPDSVTSIGKWAFNGCKSLSSVVIPDSVTSIGNSVFYECESITTITIPDSVTSIGNSAFEYCESLTAVNIPDSVTSIGNSAFEYCESLTSVTIPDSVTSIRNSSFKGCKRLTTITIPDSVSSIGDSAFQDCEKLTSVTIPDSVTSIEDSAFKGCKGLTTITIPDSVSSIGDLAFQDCEKLTSVTIPDSVTSIGNSAFEYCESLTSVTIPDSVTSIGAWAFYECKSLTSVTIPDSVTSIGHWAFDNCTSLTSVTIPDSVTSIGDCAFRGCEGLADDKGFVIIRNVLYSYHGKESKVTIPDSVTSIGDRAFEDCESLTTITIPDSVTSIGESAFSCCKSLTSVTIPDSVTSIGNGAFSDTPFLNNDKREFVIYGKVLYEYKGNQSDVVIPDSVTSIGGFAFYGCSNLTSVTIPDSVTSIGNSAFEYCESLTTITIPDSVTSIGEGAFYRCTSLTAVTIPDSVTSIGTGAFSDTPFLNNDKREFVIYDKVLYEYKGNQSDVVIPDSVTSIVGFAFYGCSNLTSVTIPDSVTSIREGTFNSCTSLTSVTIPDSVTSIGSLTFYKCKKLISVTIPNGVTSIDYGTFEGCSSLTSVTIPGSVKSVGRDAFKGCYDLKTIIFGGSLSKIPGNIPVDKIIVSDDAIRSGEKIDPRFVRVAETVDNEGLAYLLVYQTAKAWRNPLCYEAAERNVQELFELQIDILKSIEKPAAATVSAVLDYAVRFIDKLKSSSVKELYELFKEKKCKKQLKEMDEDTNLQGKLNSSESSFVAEKTFYETFMLEHKIKATKVAEAIKEFGINIDDIPALTDKEGKEIPKAIAAWLMTVHGSNFSYNYSLIGGYQEPGICPEAEEIVSRIAPDALQEFVKSFTHYLGLTGHSKKMYLAYPICRYADEETMAYLTSQAPKWRSVVSGNNAPPLLSFRQACLYSNTRSAMLFAERYHELDKYAELRGMDEDTFRDMYLSDIGLDTQGGKEYDLGNQTVTARLQKDLTFLFELPNGKTAKSLPKKGADTDKYEAAKKDFDEMKKAAKKILKSRGNVLFEDFLSGKARKSQSWKGAYISNPLLRNIAKIVVWMQGNSTFVLTDSEAIGCNGEKYTITDEEIKIAHPMEMDKADVTAWQKYFADNDLKQPFAQVWEPVRDPAQVKENRYEGCRLEVYQFSGKDKHGIHAYGVHAYSEDFGFELDDCKLGYDCDTWRLDEINGVYYTLGKFSFKKFTRKVNHIITILDKMTVSDRVLKDDASVVEQMDSFTVAQIIEFISMAQEAGAVNVTAALLEYRNNTYPDYNMMDEFVLDW